MTTGENMGICVAAAAGARKKLRRAARGSPPGNGSARCVPPHDPVVRMRQWTDIPEPALSRSLPRQPAVGQEFMHPEARTERSQVERFFRSLKEVSAYGSTTSSNFAEARYKAITRWIRPEPRRTAPAQALGCRSPLVSSAR